MALQSALESMSECGLFSRLILSSLNFLNQIFKTQFETNLLFSNLHVFLVDAIVLKPYFQ